MGKRKYETILNDEEVQWLKENCNKFSLEGLGGTLGIGVDRVRLELDCHGIKRVFKRNGPVVQYNMKLEDMSKNEYDNHMMIKKIRVVKELVNDGKKIGKYKPIKAYEHVCLVQNPKGYRETFTWSELANIYKGAV